MSRRMHTLLLEFADLRRRSRRVGHTNAHGSWNHADMAANQGNGPGRPSKGPRHKVLVRVVQDLKTMVEDQAKAEGVYIDTLLNELVAEHWPSWSTRGPLPEEAARLLVGRHSGRLGLRLPVAISEEIFAEAGDSPATAIVAELIARHLPERRRRFRATHAPQQEELALSS